MKVADALLLVVVASLATFVALETGVGTASTTECAPGVRTFVAEGAGAAERVASDSTASLGDGALLAGTAEARLETRGTTGARPDDAGGTTRALAADVPRPPAWPAAELRRRLAAGREGTYIDALLAARDSVVTRWPERVLAPLRVWIADGGTLEGWDPRFPGRVREAFDTWADTGIPVRFTHVRDSSDADVRVRFVHQFAQGISGRTIWSRDADWWLVGGDIELALAHPRGDVVSDAQLHAIALHEIGHLLGLDHVDDPTHIMAPRVRARTLSEGDRATVRLLYAVPAGSTRDR